MVWTRHHVLKIHWSIYVSSVYFYNPLDIYSTDIFVRSKMFFLIDVINSMISFITSIRKNMYYSIFFSFDWFYIHQTHFTWKNVFRFFCKKITVYAATNFIYRKQSYMRIKNIFLYFRKRMQDFQVGWFEFYKSIVFPLFRFQIFLYYYLCIIKHT